MASLRKRQLKNGFVYVVDCVDEYGVRHVISTHTSVKADAKKVLNEVIAQNALGKFNIRWTKRNNISLDKTIEFYFEDVSHIKAKSTLINEHHYVSVFIKMFPNRKISSISYEDIVKWRNKRLDQVSTTTVDIEQRFFHAFFNWCIRHEYVKANPLSNLPKLSIVHKNKTHLDKVEFKTVMTLIDKARKSARGSRDKRFMEHFQLFIMFLRLTGLRRGEGLAFQWSNVDFEHSVAHVYQSKVNRARILPLHPIVIEILQKLGPNLFSKLNKNHVSRKLKHFLVLAGLNELKLHSLRHTFATNLNQQGSSTLTIRDLLGHSSIHTTEIYAKNDITSLQREVNRIEIDLPVSDILVTRKGDVEEKG